MKLLLDYGTHINERDSRGNTALHRVCSSNTSKKEKITEVLISLGADVNIQNDFGRTCLHNLTVNNNFSQKRLDDENTARMLIGAGADLRLRDCEGLTVLLSAVKHLNYLVDCLLEYPSKIFINSCVPLTGKSILHVACQYKQRWATIKTLLNSGADAFAVDHNGNTLLHEIAQHYRSTTQDAEVIEELFKLGVPIHAKTLQGRNVIHLSTRVDFEQSYNASLWTRDTFLDVIRRLDSTFNITSRDIEGYTPLHFAVVVSEAQAYALIRAGADLSAKAKNLRTPLHCAARARQPNVISMILHYASENGLILDINAADEDGRTALHDACRSGIPESVKFLLAAGADINKPDNSGITPLVACTEFRSENALWKVLIQNNFATEVKLVDDFRFTQTHQLCESWRIANFMIKEEERTKQKSATVDVIASELIKAGATGVKTALVKAGSAGCAELVYVLRQAVDAFGENTVEPDQSDIDTAFRDPVCNEPGFRETALMLPITNMNLILEQYKGIGPKERITRFSSDMSEALVDAFLANNIDLFSKNPDPFHPDVPVIQAFVRNGRTNLMRKLLEKAKTGEDQKFSDALHTAVHDITDNYSQPKNLLQIACERATDNMDMVKLLVENFELDVNAKDLRKKLDDISQQYRFTTALHSLASGRNWWHLEAIRYLAERGEFAWALYPSNTVD
jgi:ankyrin repeat protein